MIAVASVRSRPLSKASDYDLGLDGRPDLLGHVPLPELRHEVPIGDARSVPVRRAGTGRGTSCFDARSRSTGSPRDPGRPRGAGRYEEFGYDELIAQGLPREQVELGLVVNACKALGVAERDRPVGRSRSSTPTACATRASARRPSTRSSRTAAE